MNNTTTTFHEIYEYYQEPFWHTLHFKVLIGILIAVTIGLIVYLILNRKKYQLKPWQWAIKELENITIDSYETKQEFKRFYFTVTDIIKKYLSRRYDWKTLDKTDKELICYLEDRDFDPTLLEAFKKMLEGSVWIKYAGQEVIKTQAKKDLSLARDIVEKTIPQDSLQ